MKFELSQLHGFTQIFPLPKKGKKDGDGVAMTGSHEAEEEEGNEEDDEEDNDGDDNKNSEIKKGVISEAARASAKQNVPKAVTYEDIIFQVSRFKV